MTGRPRSLRSPHPFAPEFEGEIEIAGLPEDFFTRMARRVERGLFPARTPDRTRYRVLERSVEGMAFAAEGFWTAYAVGLNQVALRRVGRERIAYHVRYGRWTRYAVVHAALIGGILVGLYALVPQMRRDVTTTRNGPVLFWGLIAFFALAWPWLLTAIHRPNAARMLERILREVAAGTAGRAESERGTPGTRAGV
jgi:hypothetical protein